MGTVRESSGKHGLNLIKMRQEVQDQKTELESQQNALSQAQELCSVNSVLKVKISLTEIELTQALKNVQARGTERIKIEHEFSTVFRITFSELEASRILK